MPSNSKKNLNKPPNYLPSSFDILDNLKCVPKIKNQGQLNSCTAFSLSSMLEINECKYFDKYTEISPLFIYKVSRNLLGVTGDMGSTMGAPMAVHLLFGVPPEKYWPYTDKKGADPDGFDREPSAFCYALAKSYSRINNIWLKLDLPGISKDLLLKRIKNVLDEDLALYLKVKAYESVLDVKGNEIRYPCPGDVSSYEMQFKVVGYDDDVEIKNPKCNLESKGAIFLDVSPVKNDLSLQYDYLLLPYDYVLKGLVKDCLVPIKNDLILNEFSE